MGSGSTTGAPTRNERVVATPPLPARTVPRIPPISTVDPIRRNRATPGSLGCGELFEVVSRLGSIDAPLTAVRGRGAVRRALVLNASYEPLSIVSARRAVCLVIDDKADLIEADGAVIRSETLAVQVPAVIRLRYMVRAPRRRTAAVSRRAVFARDEFRCQYCGDRADSIDHVLPRSRGGPHEWENLAASCRACNTAKRDRTPDEAGMHLIRPCRAPRAAAWVVLGSALVPESWKPYLPMAS